jgi:diadenylate cyclase
MVNLLHQFRWIDALDILIVAVCIYQIILALRGTRAFQMLLGLALLYLASRVALRIGLLTVNWALSNLLAGPGQRGAAREPAAGLLALPGGPHD